MGMLYRMFSMRKDEKGERMWVEVWKLRGEYLVLDQTGNPLGRFTGIHRAINLAEEWVIRENNTR